jgi:hypothetical protein
MSNFGFTVRFLLSWGDNGCRRDATLPSALGDAEIAANMLRIGL